MDHSGKLGSMGEKGFDSEQASAKYTDSHSDPTHKWSNKTARGFSTDNLIAGYTYTAKEDFSANVREPKTSSRNPIPSPPQLPVGLLERSPKFETLRMSHCPSINEASSELKRQSDQSRFRRD